LRGRMQRKSALASQLSHFLADEWGRAWLIRVRRCSAWNIWLEFKVFGNVTFDIGGLGLMSGEMSWMMRWSRVDHSGGAC
jgi:hypothetical protein